MRKGAVKVAKEPEDMDMIEEEVLEEGMVKTLPIMKRKTKVYNAQEIIEVEVSQDDTK